MSNLGWLFYKDYFRGVDYAHLENEHNEHIIQEKLNTLLNQTVTLDEDEMLGNTHFKATTTYPGLILGSGNAHELPDVKGQAILGFSFDYTSGLPVIAGSSVKGVLHSAFKHPEYIQELLDNSEIDVKALETEIFDNGDVFFDAVVITSGKLLGDDYITPHGDALKNPIPLRFIKVLPNVTFRFDFELSSGLINKSEKAKLFQEILADLGLGAKTNVGYGKFDNFRKEQTEEERELEKLEREEEAFNEAIKSNALEKLEQFQCNFPNSTRDVEGEIAKIKHKNKIADIEKAFDNLNKSNKNHVDSFRKKYQDNPDAKEFMNKLHKEKGDSSEKIGIEGLSDIENDADAFKKILHDNKGVAKANRELIEKHVLRICVTLDEKEQNKFLKAIKLDKYIDKAFGKQMKEAVKK